MIYALFNEANKVVGIAHSYEEAQRATKPAVRFQSRNDWDTLAEVEAIAAQLSALTGDLYIAYDKSSSRPRFDLFKAPKIGDEVSMGFNGDYYPCGKIATISKTMKKIVTDNGTVFYRRSMARWLNKGTFAMIPGVHDERNPHF
jgi:hypothetical protein